MKYMIAAVGVGLIVGGVMMFSARPTAVAAHGDEPVGQWSVSKAYTADNREVAGTLIASVDSRDGKGRLDVRCSDHFAAVYLQPDDAPKPEAGTETITYIGSLDGGAEKVGHARTVGSLMELGQTAEVARLVGAGTLRLKYTPVLDDSMRVVDFDLHGLPGALNEMRSVCGNIR